MSGGGSPMKSSKSDRGGGGSGTNKMLLLLVFIMLAFNLYQQTASMSDLYNSTQYFDTSHYDGDYNDREDEDEADRIIRQSYEKSYAHILPCDPKKYQENKKKNEGFAGKECMKKTLDYFNTPNNATKPSIPWWFQTLLRDTQVNGAYGFWHHFYTTQPAFNFCTIGKVATTEWRRVFCKLNEDDCIKDPAFCGKRKCAWRTAKTMPIDAPWAVFLRDPLERLLSGYLDKCYKPNVRYREQHCEPNIVFNMDPSMVNKKKKLPNLLEHLEDKDKQMFAAYVDVLPLKVRSI